MKLDRLNGFFDDVMEGYAVGDVFDHTVSHDELHRDAAKALVCCVNTMGCVNLSWMSEHSGLTVGELIEALDGIIFQDPEIYDKELSDEEGWMLRPQYVSGNVFSKYRYAKRMNRKYKGRFASNVSVLKEAKPEKVPFEEIGICIKNCWVPPMYYAHFAKELLGVKTMPEVFHSSSLGRWKVKGSVEARKSSNNTEIYGYTYKNQGEIKCITMLEILEHTLNGSTIKIYEEVSRPDRKSGTAQILLKNETIAAQEKQALLEQAFKDWIVKDPTRVKMLENLFYDALSCNVATRYNGNFLTLPELNPEFCPYPHQRDAVARMVLEKDVLLNHTVGSGKTGILIMGIHERYRMGLSRKNLVVVPNNVLEAFERTHHFLYPKDNILVIHPEDFKPALRQKAMESIRDGDFTAIYMAVSSFDMICMSRQFQLDKKSEEIHRMHVLAASTQDKWEKKIFESKVKKLRDELTKMQENLPEDKGLSFDQLGITTLVVDEAHHFKNITLKTSADNIVGMHAKGSKKCNEMMEKAQFVRSHNGSLIFSTGTPITNSLSDLFVLQMFLQPEQMRLLNLDYFDAWIGTFASRQAGFEVDVDSQNYRIMTRFSRFHNLPELIRLFSSVCDSYDGADHRSGLPACDGYIDTIVPKSPEQSEYIDELVLRTEMIREKLVKSYEDNLLKVTHDGRAAALDIRLVSESVKIHSKQTKIYACAKNVYACWKEHPGTAQLVFCDIGTPKKGFNIYDELKHQLMDLGIPEDQIAFVHDAGTDAKRRKMFEDVNKAKIRVLIGSTSKLGTGVNVQENLVAIHHLDVPWKPSDMVQREGRLIRQGNKNSEVYRYRYITVGTFDAYSWQIVENKQRFIGRFMGGVLVDREARDIDDVTLTYAEIKALSVGDPLLKTRIETSNVYERTKIHSNQRASELRKMQVLINEAPEKLDLLDQRKKRLMEDRNYFWRCREKLTKEERHAFGEELLHALQENHERDKERCFETLHGFRVVLPSKMRADKPYVWIAGSNTNRYDVDMRDAKAVGCIQRIEYVLLHLGDRIRGVEEQISGIEKEIMLAKSEIAKGNTYIKEMERLSKQLVEIDEELNCRAQADTIE